MAGAGGAGDEAQRAALRHGLSDLDARLDVDVERGPGARRRFERLVEQLRTPAAAFLRPELEQRLARYVDADDSLARDLLAHILAGACGEEALPALLRAMVSDRNDDGDTLQLDVLDLLDAWPETSLRLVLDHVASDDPGTRLVGLWGLSVIDFGGTTYFGLIADAASDPEPRVRAEVMNTLGTIFGAGDPTQALAILIAGTEDAAPEVRSAAVAALHSSRDDTVTAILVARAGDVDPRVRYSAAWSLARRPSSEARAALERLTMDEDADVLAAARKALGPPTSSL
ncbi:HEAT repeat domain-containing protein [Streptomyces sp. NPDC000410]|uniref:HEAT repeat domain-containing protein n=1 Tax=Streptomyces sp. NPDC000410 TaxID=3154254 RepID=UPI00331CA48C